MESVSILRALSRRPLLLGLGALLAVAVGLLAAYQVSLLPPGVQGKATTAGFAQQRVLVDTPTSLVADAKAKGASAIVIRAAVLADLISSDGVRAEIAREVGVAPGAVGTISSTVASPQTESPLAKQVLEVTRPVEPYVISVGLEAGQPILSIQTVAPDPHAAARLISATTTALVRAGRGAAPARGPVRVERLGSAQVGARQAGGSKKKAALAASAIFILWCVALAAADGIAHRRRLAGDWESGSGVSA